MNLNGPLGFFIMLAHAWALINVLQSAADTGKKVLWSVIVVVLPVVGFILWLFLGPRAWWRR